ncbi:MAG: M20/M25/M40 family metallo-hydrolase, partial [Candidatus Freyarchaeota archaeon]|nr:M20/M25/M40 family metallo-hydrolase [Candidatus Jordarchaeia archaeon]
LRWFGVDAIELACKLIEFDTSNPPGNQRECADYIADYLKSFSNVRIYEKDGVRNVLAELTFSRGEPTLAFNGHWDTVPWSPEAWVTHPLKPVIHGGWLYGRGAADMKGGLAALISAFEDVSGLEGLEGKLFLMAVGDEETGGFKGTRHLLSRTGLRPDYVLIGETTDLLLKVGRRGIIQAKLKVYGDEMHSSRVYLSYVSSIEICSELTLLVKRLDPGDAGDIMPRTTFAVTIFEAGVKENVVPRVANMHIDIRNTPKVSSRDVEALLKRELERLKEKYGEFKYELDVREAAKPYIIRDSYFVRVLEDIYRKLGLTPTHDAGGGASDGRFFVEEGVRNVVEVGPIGKNIHGINEKVEAESILQTQRIYREAAIAILRSGGTDFARKSCT